jgi:hypothetical protein
LQPDSLKKCIVYALANNGGLQHTADGVGHLMIVPCCIPIATHFPKKKRAALGPHFRRNPCLHPLSPDICDTAETANRTSGLSEVAGGGGGGRRPHATQDNARSCRSRVPRTPPILWNLPLTLAKIQMPPSTSRLGCSRTSRSLPFIPWVGTRLHL